MHYLRWAKTHKRAKYELALSGVPPISIKELSDEPIPVDLEVLGDYGDPRFIERVAGLYGVPESNVLPVPGTSSANFMALAVAARAGDTILLEHPRYDPLERAAAFLRLKIDPLHRVANHGFGVDCAALEEGLSRGAKAVVLSNLHNPTGGYLGPDVVEQMAMCCGRFDATLIIDEVYLDAVHLTTGAPRWTAASRGDNVMATSSLTKVYGLGGLRAGWIFAGDRYIERLRDVMDVLSVETPAPVASLATAALSKLARLGDRYREIHATGSKVFRSWLDAEEQLSGYTNEGALFEWVRLPGGVSARQLCDVLADDYDTQIVSGHYFGVDDHVRISLTADARTLSEGLSRVSDAIARQVGK